MGKHCQNCGAGLQEQSKFCVYCGSSVAQNQAVQQQESSYIAPVQQQYAQYIAPVQQQYAQYIAPVQQYAHHTYNVRQNPAYNPGSAPKLNHTIFLFVTTLIFMIYFSLRTFVLMVLSGSWDFSSWRILYTAMSIAVFSIAIAQFVSSNGVFKKSNPMEKRIQASRKLSSLSITLFVLGLVLLIFTFFRLSNTSTYSLNSTLNELFVFMGVFITFDFVFVIFALINMIKSKNLKEEIVSLNIR